MFVLVSSIGTMSCECDWLSWTILGVIGGRGPSRQELNRDGANTCTDHLIRLRKFVRAKDDCCPYHYHCQEMIVRLLLLLSVVEVVVAVSSCWRVSDEEEESLDFDPPRSPAEGKIALLKDPSFRDETIFHNSSVAMDVLMYILCMYINNLSKLAARDE